MKKIIKILLLICYVLVLLIPGYTFLIVNRNLESLFASQTLHAFLLLFFRLLGLYAFILLWNQIMLGVFWQDLTRLFTLKVLKIHMGLGILALFFILLHPLLFYLTFLLAGVSPLSALGLYVGPNRLVFAYAGVGGFLLVLLTAASALLRKKPFLKKHWRKIHALNYLVFVLVFVHSFFLGSDTRTEPLAGLYLFCALTFVFSLFYRFYLKRKISFLRKRQ